MAAAIPAASCAIFFEVSREFVVLAALKSLADEGRIEASTVSEAMRKLGISADKIDPLSV